MRSASGSARFGAFVCARRDPPGVGRLPVKSTVTREGTQPASDALAESVPQSACGSYGLTCTCADGFCPSKMVLSAQAEERILGSHSHHATDPQRARRFYADKLGLTCTGYLVHLFMKSHCKSERACLHWLQKDVQLR